MKYCRQCNQKKPLTDFHRRGKGYQPWCKVCRKSYDHNFWKRKSQEYIPKKLEALQKHREWLISLKKDKRCTDCGQAFHHAAMQWDHLPEFKKLFNLSDTSKRYNKEKILAEIAKCELVCANCHAVRTYNRRQGLV